jgi:hypothetical protein
MRTAFVALFMLSAAVAGCTSADAESTGQSSDSLTDHNWKILNVQYERQTTGYWCGPTATKIALSARMSAPSQASLATQLHTTTRGTDSIDQVRDVLNANLGGAPYVSTILPHDPPTPEEKSRFWDDLVRSIDQNYPVVANIVAPPSNHPPGYPNNDTIFHYFTVIGYNPDTREAYIADPANFGGHQQYWLTFDQLATLVPPKGYAAIGGTGGGGTRCPGAGGLASGAIGAKYDALGGCGSVLGVPTTNEQATPDGVGRYTVFDRGSIYWTQATGAFEVHGVIRDQWKALAWEAGVLGYPIGDEIQTPDMKGRYNVFEHGSIYWTEETGAHEVLGFIRDKWKALGWETGALGYPISGEQVVTGGRKSDFQHGSLTWNSATGAVTVVMNP